MLTNHPKIKHLPQVVYHIVAEIINKMDTTPPPISASTSTKASSKVTNLKHDAEEKLLGLGADRLQRNWKAWLSMAVVMV